MPQNRKKDVITFKVDRSLARALRGIANRSEFIRNAILAAMENACPLCSGTGILSADQRQHWEDFAANHSVEECGKCHVLHIVCQAGPVGGDGH
ncbi:MAG: ribbon-helix-helix domain-containing protein [Planctomycetota bacterium]|jgi:hypothetical protein